MNYTLFYKMIKEAQPATPSTTPAPAPTAPANSQFTDTTSQQSTSVTSTNTYTPSPIRSEDVYGMVKNKPVPGMNPVPTAEQLANRWIQEKEDFYHNKADKYPQYANWHVSNQTRAHLMQQAQDMIKEHPEEAARIWAQQQYNPASPTSVYRDEAFQYANRGNKDYVDKRNGKIQGGAAGQNAPMQNPTATSAIPNPAPYTPLTNSQIIERGVPIMEREFRSGWSPDSTSPQAYDFRNRMRLALREIMPNVPEEQRYWRFLELLQNNGIKGFGSDFLNNAITQMSNGYWDSRYGDSYINLSPEDRFKVSQNISFNNIMQNPDGTYNSWNTLPQQ